MACRLSDNILTTSTQLILVLVNVRLFCCSSVRGGSGALRARRVKHSWFWLPEECFEP